jgi:four helix bundle protein
MKFAYDVYQIVSALPDFEKFGLSSQLRRAVISVPSNIAEGSGRQYKKEFVQFLFLAKGSLREAMTQLELSKMFGY